MTLLKFFCAFAVTVGTCIADAQLLFSSNRLNCVVSSELSSIIRDSERHETAFSSTRVSVDTSKTADITFYEKSTPIARLFPNWGLDGVLLNAKKLKRIDSDERTYWNLTDVQSGRYLIDCRMSE